MQQEKAANDLFEILVEHAYPITRDNPELHQTIIRLQDVYTTLTGVDKELLWDMVQQTRQARAGVRS